MRTVRALVAVGAPLLCDALVALLGTEEDIYAVSAPGGFAAVAQAIVEFEPAVLVIDWKGEGDSNVSLLGQSWPLRRQPSVVALVSSDQRLEAPKLLFAGASAVVLKTDPVAELVSAVHWAAYGGGFISPPLLRGMFAELRSGNGRIDDRLRKLTTREHEIVQLMVDGLGRKQIAQQLYLSVDTVRAHLRTIMEKLDAHSATATVSVALAAGLRPRR